MLQDLNALEIEGFEKEQIDAAEKIAIENGECFE